METSAERDHVASFLNHTRQVWRDVTLEGVDPNDVIEDLQRDLGVPEGARCRVRLVESIDRLAETVELRRQTVVIVDFGLVEACMRLGQFVDEHLPAEQVMAWCLGEAAVTFARFGGYGEAASVLCASGSWAGAPPPPKRGSSSDFAIHHYFILAHETAHTALTTGDPDIVARKGFDAMADDLLDSIDLMPTGYSDHRIQQGIDATKAADERIWRAAARNARVEDYPISQPTETALKVPRDYREIVAARRQMKEEFRCDIIATELTMAYAFHAMAMRPEQSLPVIYRTVLALDALERIRQQARSLLGQPRSAQVIEVQARKLFWLWHAAKAYGHHLHGGDADMLLKSLDETRYAYADYVLDILNEVFPAEVIELLLKVPESILVDARNKTRDTVQLRLLVEMALRARMDSDVLPSSIAGSLNVMFRVLRVQHAMAAAKPGRPSR
jgi:hypothetical protein